MTTRTGWALGTLIEWGDECPPGWRNKPDLYRITAERVSLFGTIANHVARIKREHEQGQEARSKALQAGKCPECLGEGGFGGASSQRWSECDACSGTGERT